MRPIDADALKESARKVSVFRTYDAGTPDLRALVDTAPTLDYAPVRHGEWKNCGQISRTQWLWRCSLCGCPQDYNHNYCPNCGAKMDGGKKDG